MKVLLLTENMRSDRASFRIMERHARLLANYGFSVTLVSPTFRRRLLPSFQGAGDLRFLESPGWAPMALRRGGFSLLDLFFKVWICITEKPDVVHATCSHRPAQFLAAVIAKVLWRAAVVDEWWEWYAREGRGGSRTSGVQRLIGWYDQAMELRVKSLFDAVIAISSALAARIDYHPKVRVLHGALEIHQLQLVPKEEARRELGMASDSLVFGLPSVGEADHADNAPFFEAFSSLARKDPSMKLFLTGEQPYLERIKVEFRLGPRLVGGGWLDYGAYVQHMAACDAFVLPLLDTPRNQGRWPHKLGDYLWFQRPVIASDVGDVGTLFRSHRLGVLCDGSAEGFRSAIVDLLRHPNHVEMSRDAVMVVGGLLSPASRTAAIADIYLSVRQGKAGTSDEWVSNG